MRRMELADIYDLYRLKKFKWEYSDFAKALSKEEFLGYGVIDVDAGGVGYDIITQNNKEIFNYNRYAKNVALRPTMNYSYVEDFIENKKEIKDGIFEVTFGEYPNSKIEEEISEKELVKTGRSFTIKENNELIKLDEYVDKNDNKMVMLNNNYYKVEALTWLVDTYKDIMITKDAINGGFAYEAKLTEEEEYIAEKMDNHIPRKLSTRSIMIAEKERNDYTLANNFMSHIMHEEIIGEEMLKKLDDRDAEKERKEKEEQDRIEELIREKRRLYDERTRAQRERKKLLECLFPTDANYLKYSFIIANEDIIQLNQVISEELPNVKNYIDDKDKLIELIIETYKCKDARERLLPYPQSRYDLCRKHLEDCELDYLNITLMLSIGEDKILNSHIEYLINNSKTLKLN